jgi:hypothetical protein
VKLAGDNIIAKLNNGIGGGVVGGGVVGGGVVGGGVVGGGVVGCGAVDGGAVGCAIGRALGVYSSEGSTVVTGALTSSIL